jgi:hypothetical protein
VLVDIKQRKACQASPVPLAGTVMRARAASSEVMPELSTRALRVLCRRYWRASVAPDSDVKSHSLTLTARFQGLHKRWQHEPLHLQPLASAACPLSGCAGSVQFTVPACFDSVPCSVVTRQQRVKGPVDIAAKVACEDTTSTTRATQWQRAAQAQTEAVHLQRVQSARGAGDVGGPNPS